MIGITFSGSANKLGDKIIFTSLPENYYKTTGDKLIDIDKHFLFDYNPYVLRNEKPSEIIGLWRKMQGAPPNKTIAHQIAEKFGVKVFINHPALYYGGIEKYSKSLTIHTTGETVGGIPVNVSNYIRKKYSDLGYEFIWQVGTQDLNIGCFDRRGLSFWESVDYIAKSEVFIGVDSAMMHVAAAYPSVRSKIILVNKTEQEIENFAPWGSPNSSWSGWVYYNCEYYNATEKDIGITRSYIDI